MKIRENRFMSAAAGFCAAAISAIMLAFMCYLLPMSFFRTTDMSTGTGGGEIVTFGYDNIFLNLIMLFMSVCVIYLLWKYFESVSMKRVLLIMSLWIVVFGLGFVASARLQPSEDSYILTFFAREAARGDLSYYHEYFRFFPYQFGFVLYAEGLFRLFYALMPTAPEGFSSLMLQGMNVLYTAFSCWALVMLSVRIFKNESAGRLTAALLMLCFPALFFVTYMYGNIPSFACVCAALWAYSTFESDGKWSSGFAALVLLSLAVILKLNSLIVVVAVLIACALWLLRRPSLRPVIFALALVFMLSLTSALPQRLYEKRTGESFGDGIPMLSWLAMGMYEGESCSGWYSPVYTTTAFKATGYEPEATAYIAEEAIVKRFEYFRSAPVECRRFFGRKLLSQWNEPSYQGLWTNQVREHYSEPGMMYQLLCHRFERIVKAVMNVYQQFVFFAFALGLLRILRRRNSLMSLLPLVVLGGMLYHLLFEAKSQHSQGYFMLMLPVAAYGLIWLFEHIRDSKAN